MNCKNLGVWQRSCRISVEIYNYFKTSKDYSFKDQITRSSLSVASNIAEGMEKDSNKDKNRFLNISQGSISELVIQIYRDRDRLHRKKLGLKWIDELEQINKMLTSFKKES